MKVRPALAIGGLGAVRDGSLDYSLASVVKRATNNHTQTLTQNVLGVGGRCVLGPLRLSLASAVDSMQGILHTVRRRPVILRGGGPES